MDVASRFVPIIYPANTHRLKSQGRTIALPENIAMVLSIHIKLPLEDVHELWRVLGDVVLMASAGELVLEPGETDEGLSGIAPSHNLGAFLSRLSICIVICPDQYISAVPVCRCRDHDMCELYMYHGGLPPL